MPGFVPIAVSALSGGLFCPEDVDLFLRLGERKSINIVDSSLIITVFAFGMLGHGLFFWSIVEFGATATHNRRW